MGLTFNFQPVAAPLTVSEPQVFTPAKPKTTSLDDLIDSSLTREERICKAIGEPISTRHRSAADIAAVLQDGVLCTVTASHYRGTLHLDLADLGINKADDPGLVRLIENRNVQLGRKIILPKDMALKVDTAAQAARKALYDHSFRTDAGYWIPTKRWASFKAAFVKAHTEFRAALMHIAVNRDALIVPWIDANFRPLAAKAWEAKGADWCKERGFEFDVTQVEQKFSDEFVERIIAELPSGEEILEGELSYRITMLTSPDAELAAKYAPSDKSLNAELQEHVQKEKKELITKFLQSARQGLAESIANLVKTVQERLVGHSEKGRTKVNKKIINNILTTIADLRDLNVVNDAKIEQTLADLEKFVNEQTAKSPEGAVSPDALREQMETTTARIAALLNEQLATTNEFDVL